MLDFGKRCDTVQASVVGTRSVSKKATNKEAMKPRKPGMRDVFGHGGNTDDTDSGNEGKPETMRTNCFNNDRKDRDLQTACSFYRLRVDFYRIGAGFYRLATGYYRINAAGNRLLPRLTASYRINFFARGAREKQNHRDTKAQR
jgi:hypothetical protein